MDKETPVPADISLSIGKSTYLLSSEAQKYLRKFQPEIYDFKGADSVEVVLEPHFSLEGQISLFKGLEVLFHDNPKLANKTVFLAEGYPANQLVSVSPLIEEEPHPSDELISKVLGSYLINSYMAYEWKHQRGIPIVGIEDKLFYGLSRDLILAETKKPGELFTQISFQDGAVIDITFEDIQFFSYVIRNKKMIETMIEMRNYYENPMLFVGYAHLKTLNEEGFNFFRSIAEGALSIKFGPYGEHIKAAAENLGIVKYLIERDIGFSVLNPVYNREIDFSSSEENKRYDVLFNTQQQGEWKRNSREAYRRYLDYLLQQKRAGLGTTTKPSPEAAAQYIRALRGKTVFEAKTTERKGGWFQVQVDLVRKRLGQDTMWDKGIAPRGGNFERLVGANLASNCPVIDHYDAKNQTVISLKSMDLESGSYVDQEEISFMIGRYIEDLSEFDGVHWTPPGTSEPIIISHDEKIGQVFKHRILEVAIPLGLVSSSQKEELNKLQAYAETVGVILDIIEVA